MARRDSRLDWVAVRRARRCDSSCVSCVARCRFEARRAASCAVDCGSEGCVVAGLLRSAVWSCGFWRSVVRSAVVRGAIAGGSQPGSGGGMAALGWG